MSFEVILKDLVDQVPIHLTMFLILKIAQFIIL